jgi:hypothetical protein
VTQGGPQTPGGKSVSRWNSSKHGLRSNAPVIPGLETSEDWEAHLEGILQSLQPEGHLEQVLAERVALQSWRLHRVTRYEREAVALTQESVEADFHAADNSSSLQTISTLKSNLERTNQTRELIGQLKEFGENEHLPSSPALNAVNLAYERVNNVVAEDISQLELPGIPQEVTNNDLRRFRGWTVELVKEAIGAYAECAGRRFEDLYNQIEEDAQKQVDRLKASLEREQRGMESQLDRLHRERLLPEDKTLEKIARYEAHISRQMYQALHELEALQTRRGGGSAPLGRLDVQGTSET